jgi:hypothetical protein
LRVRSAAHTLNVAVVPSTDWVFNVHQSSHAQACR